MRWSRVDLPILVAFAALAFAYAIVVPIFEAPDEPDHLAYVDYLATRHELPNQFEPGRIVANEGNQPPLYYGLGALLVHAFGQPFHHAGFDLVRNPTHLWNGGTRFAAPLFLHPVHVGSAAYLRLIYALRVLSVVLGTANLAAILALARRLASGPRPALIAGLLVAALPQYAFHCAVLGNDVLAWLLANLALLALFQIPTRPERLGPFLGLGVALGLALITKKTALTLLPGVAAVLAWTFVTQIPVRLRPRWVSDRILPLFVCLTTLAAWWFLRNDYLYGDPLGTAMERKTLAAMVTPRPLLSSYFLTDFPRNLLETSIGRFGWLNIALPWPVYAVAGVFLAASVVGLALRFPRLGEARARLVLAALFPLGALAGVIHFNLTFTQPQGRYLFIALGPLAVLVAEGVDEWLGRLPARIPRRRILVALVGLALALQILGLVRTLRAWPGTVGELLGP